MQWVTNFLTARLLLILAFVSIALLPNRSIAQSTAARMQNVVRKFVQQAGFDIVGVGSWIRGGEYRDVLKINKLAEASDHDLRLLIPQSHGAEEAASRWRSGRQQLIRLVNEEFGKDAPLVLQKTNLYPPSQLISAIEDADDVTRLFVRHNQVPNLGYSQQVTSKIPQKFTEGLYGDGAKAWTQAYERNAGTRFYNVKGNVFTSGTQYLHTIEGEARFASTGVANTARQWISHAAECMEASDAKGLGKYLERVERDLTKSRALIGVAADETWKTEMRTLASQLKSSPSSLNILGDRVTQVLQRASMESAILARVEGSSNMKKAMLRTILGAIQGGDDLGRKILELSGKIPVDKLMDAIMAAVAARELGIALGEDDYAKAIASLGIAIDPFFIGLLAQITHQSLEAAKDAGTSFVANRQDCEDLMAGIFTGGAFEAEGRSYTHDQPFEHFKSDAQIRSFVMARAKEASARDLGKKADEIDDDVAQGKFDKCYPCIAGIWNARREHLEAEYHSLLEDVANAPITLTYMPAPLNIDPETVKATARVAVVEAKEVAAKMNRMKKIATELTGALPTLHYFYSWSTKAKTTNNQEQNLYEYEAPGFYTVEVTRHLKSEIQGRKDAVSLKNYRSKVTQGIDVIVEGRKSDGTYEGIFTFDAIRLVNERGESFELDVTKAKVINEVKLKLVIQGETSTMNLSVPDADVGAVSVKLSGDFTAAKNEASLTKVVSYDFKRPGIKKFEMSAQGRLKESDSVAGTFKVYIAAEVPSEKEGETETGFVHASGKWTARLKEDPAKPKSSKTGKSPKSGKK
jgi:hypothetical protein